MTRIIIIGGPLRGKSTLARELNAGPIYCGDYRNAVRDPQEGVAYLPDEIPMFGDSGAAPEWIVANWFSLPGPWVCEGWIMARALRRWNSAEAPADRIIVLDRPFGEPTKKQDAMHKGVMTVWREIAPRFAEISEEETEMKTPTILRREAERAEKAFDAAVKFHRPSADRWEWYRAHQNPETFSREFGQAPEIIAAHDAYIRALHAFYFARDGANGFLGGKA